LKAIVEALIFASPEPLTPRMLFRLLAEEPKEDVSATIQALKADYETRPGLQFVEVAGGYQIVTRTELHEWVRAPVPRAIDAEADRPIAGKHWRSSPTSSRSPLWKSAEIRGVNTSGVLATLLERHLIKIVGRKNVVGRPFLYATTKEFLIRFGLNDLSDLPKIEDMAEALGFDPPARLIEQTPAEEMLPLDEPEESGGSGQVEEADR
jgi:segregation and condensation protein B